MEQADCVVIGAGVIGLAVARRLAIAGRDVVVLERAATIGAETSSRSSEVIHGGLYYPPASLKARLCVAGREALYRYCGEHGVGHARIGKLIVAATAEDEPALARIAARAEASGAGTLARLDAAGVRALEPEVRGTAALLSPRTGIVDSHGLMLAYLGDAEARGTMVAYESPVTSGEVGEGGIVVAVGGAAPLRLRARTLVCCAGLDAPRVMASFAGFPVACVPPRLLAKGSYFALSGRAPFARLIYPVPGPTGLGIHAALDLAGRCRFGPDVEWVERVDYAVDPARAERFYAAIRRYWPGLPADALDPAYAGIRPKVARGGADVDFVVQGPRSHGIPGLVALYGIDSPGLTASLALAEHVAGLLGT